jgi:hypothetical protein
MKLNRLETHDRYEHFTKQKFDIADCCQNLVNQRPFGEHPFYIFAHTRTDEDGVTKRLIWQPRLTKPLPQTNSMLFKAFPGSDNIKVIWIIPSEEMWKQYSKGNITESNIVYDSIQAYRFNRNKLNEKDPDDLSDIQIDAIYRELAQQARQNKIFKSEK